MLFRSARDLRIEDTPHEALGENQLRVHMRAGGICGSDLHYFQHGGFGTVRVKQPMVLGHEVSGVVAEVGAAVFLSSAASDFVNGHILYVDGGVTATL